VLAADLRANQKEQQTSIAHFHSNAPPLKHHGSTPPFEEMRSTNQEVGGGSLVRNVQVCDSAGTRFTEQSKINNFPSLLPRAVIGVEETEKRERTFKERED
jgi:hypothetical protein